MTGAFQRLALLALALVAWALADQIGGNGFIAAFVGGLAVGPTAKSAGEQLIRFTDAEGQLLSLSVFFVFGALAIGLIRPLSWEIALYALCGAFITQQAVFPKRFVAGLAPEGDLSRTVHFRHLL